MGTIVDQISTAFRDFAVDGVASSGAHDVVKSEVRAVGPLIETALANVALGALVSISYATKAEIDADLNHDADSVGIVYADGTDANNDLYIKVGASGAGSWTLTTILHDVFGSISEANVAAMQEEVDANRSDINLISEAGKNLFNPNDPDVDLSFFVVYTTGALAASGTYNATGFIPVQEGVQYTRNYSHQMAFYDANKVYVSGLPANAPATTATQFTVPAGVSFARLSVAKTIYSTFQVELGATPTFYTPYKRVIKESALSSLSGVEIPDESISIQKIIGVDRGTNLFNSADAGFVAGSYVSYTTGALIANATYSATGFIPVLEGEQYTASYVHQRAFYNEDQVYISGSNTGSPATFTVPNGAYFMRLTMLASGVSTFQVQEGGAATDYEAYRDPVIGYDLLPSGIQGIADRLDAVTTDAGASLANPLNPEFLRSAKYLLMQRLLGETAQIVISAAGDSYTHRDTRWIGPFMDYMAAKYGDAGGGWSGFGFNVGANSVPWTGINQPQYRQGNVRPTTYPMIVYGNITSTYHSTASGSPDLATASLTQSGDYITQAIPASPVHDECLLFFIGTADGQIRWRWDAGSWTTIDVQGTVDQVQTVSLAAGIPSGAGLLTIEWIAGTAKLCGVDLRSSADGIRVNKLALTGSRADQWADAPETEWERALGFLGHDMFFYMDGANSQSNAISATSWGGSIDTIVSRVRAANPGVDFLLAVPPENQSGFSIPMSSYAIEAKNRSSSSRISVLDLQAAFGDADDPTEYGSAGAVPLFNSDNIHPEPLTGGRRMLAEILRTIE